MKSKNSNSIIITIVLIAIVIGGLMLLTGPRPDTKGAVKDLTALTASEKSYDFGTVSMAQGKVSHVFKVKNNGSDKVLVSKVYTSCMCTEATLTTVAGGSIGPFGMQGHGPIPTINQIIAPGETASVEAVFDPNAHGPAGVGRIARTIFLESGDQSFELNFSANVTP